MARSKHWYSVLFAKGSSALDNAWDDTTTLQYRIMRTEFCEVATTEEARTKCPWAAEIIEVDGGFMAFESMDDYNTWSGQADPCQDDSMDTFPVGGNGN